MTIKTLDSVDRFDLEQEIMKCWNVTDDLDVFLSRYLDGPEMSEDEVANVVLGLSALYKLKFEKLWDTFEQLLKNGGFTSNIDSLNLNDSILKKIDTLKSEVVILKSRLQPHDTGHLHTAIKVLEDRIEELECYNTVNLIDKHVEDFRQC